MTGYTPSAALPYPEGGDAVAVHTDVQKLAMKADAELALTASSVEVADAIASATAPLATRNQVTTQIGDAVAPLASRDQVTTQISSAVETLATRDQVDAQVEAVRWFHGPATLSSTLDNLPDGVTPVSNGDVAEALGLPTRTIGSVEKTTIDSLAAVASYEARNASGVVETYKSARVGGVWQGWEIVATSVTYVGDGVYEIG